MARPLTGMNPRVLKWARERAGLTISEVAEALRKDVAAVSSWESGESLPTYRQLERLAYQLYKRPLAIFFFPEPPIEEDPVRSFRTLPLAERDQLNSDTRYALRQAEAMQIALTELHDGVNPAERQIFRNLYASRAPSASDLAARVRQYLGVSVSEQIDWRNTRVALQHWRDAVQDAGVYVFKRSFKQRDISGFCLLHSLFPIVYLNNSVPDTRQIFTIFHELAHILVGTAGLTKADDTFIRDLTGAPRRVETVCNEFAAEFLVPSDDFNALISSINAHSDEHIARLARRYSVSREVILRKFRDRKIVTDQEYRARAEKWAREYKNRPKSGHGNYYANQAAYLGKKYISVAFGRYYQGRCTLEQLADYLNVKVQSLSGLEPFATVGLAG